MNRAILANLGFEYELASRPLTAAVRAQQARFAAILRIVDGWRDADLVDADAPPADRELLAWGASSQARAIAGRGAAGWPDVEIVREVNDKRFSHQLEQLLGIALPGACIVCSVDELAEASRTIPDWVAKHPYGVAGREQLRGAGWDDSLRDRAVKLFSTTASLVFEPWIADRVEYSFHFDIRDDGVHRVGCTALSTRGSSFRGNRTDAKPPPSMWPVVDAAARAVATAGYTGPVGIDSFVGERDDGRVVRPVMEINARWTFGRLALELATSLGTDLVWHHPAGSGRPDGLVPLHSGDERGPRLLPAWCDPAGASGCWAELLDARPEIDGPHDVC